MKTKIEDAITEQDNNSIFRKIAEQSFVIAKSMGAEVVLLHVTSDSSENPLSESVTIMGFSSRKVKNSIQPKGAKGSKNATIISVNKSTHNPGDFTMKMMVKKADFAESVLNAAKDLHLDLMFWAQTNGKQ